MRSLASLRDDNIAAFKIITLLCFCLFITGCAHAPSSPLPSISPVTEISTETRPINIDAIPDAIPKDEPLSPKGNDSPYEFAGKKYEVLPKAQSYSAIGIASWYGKQFQGKRTASGERFDMFSMTAAHRSLPLPSYVKVTNLSNNKSVVVRINDRGPFIKGRLIDVSYAAAVKLGLIATGHARVKMLIPLVGVGPCARPSNGQPQGVALTEMQAGK